MVDTSNAEAKLRDLPMRRNIRTNEWRADFVGKAATLGATLIIVNEFSHDPRKIVLANVFRSTPSDYTIFSGKCRFQVLYFFGCRILGLVIDVFRATREESIDEKDKLNYVAF